MALKIKLLVEKRIVKIKSKNGLTFFEIKEKFQKKMEEKFVAEINRNFGKKLKQNLKSFTVGKVNYQMGKKL